MFDFEKARSLTGPDPPRGRLGHESQAKEDSREQKRADEDEIPRTHLHLACPSTLRYTSWFICFTLRVTEKGAKTGRNRPKPIEFIGGPWHAFKMFCWS
jgi:hypothetical protein